VTVQSVTHQPAVTADDAAPGRPRPAVMAMPGYRPGRSAAAAEAEHGIADAVKLASNELPFGPLPSVAAAIRDAVDGVSVYPDHRATELREAIARSVGVTSDRITVGAGSVGLLQQLALTYLDVGDGVAFCWPSFEAYPQFAGLVQAEQISPPLRRQTFDMRALATAVDSETKLVLIANPNNPTGTIVGTDEIAALVERVPSTCLVVVDEAYAEFVTDPRIGDSIALLDRYPNVLVLRTFSKAHALAALRIGYAIGHPGVIGALDRTLVPFVVNGLGQQAAIASLAALDEMRERAAAVVAERSSLAAALWRSGWGVPEPQGNFVWLPAGSAAADLGVGLERLGVVTRVFPDVGVRVTISDAAANDRFLEAFTKVAVDLDASAWQLPTGDLAVRIAGHLVELDGVLARLETHAVTRPPAGLTEPDPGGTEQWDVGQVWAHLAEFGSYWRGELRTIVDAPRPSDGGADAPVPFGRTKRDPHRVAMIEEHRHEPIVHHVATVRRDVAAFRADLAEFTAADWARRGVHETLGVMDLWRFLDHFVTGHYVEHADQLDGLRGREHDG
jgi:histidinol-phosphate aminotransferase